MLRKNQIRSDTPKTRDVCIHSHHLIKRLHCAFVPPFLIQFEESVCIPICVLHHHPLRLARCPRSRSTKQGRIQWNYTRIPRANTARRPFSTTCVCVDPITEMPFKFSNSRRPSRTAKLPKTKSRARFLILVRLYVFALAQSQRAIIPFSLANGVPEMNRNVALNPKSKSSRIISIHM